MKFPIMTFTTMTFSIATLNIATQNLETLIKMTSRIRISSITTLSTMTKMRHTEKALL
jgi:hypothetical protein